MFLEIPEFSIFIRLFVVSVYMSAALCIYLMFLNRKLIAIKSSPYKNSLIIFTFIFFMVISGIFGYAAGLSIWFGIPVIILSGIIVGEIRLAVLRRRYLSTPPVAIENVSVSLTKPFTTTELKVACYDVPCLDSITGELTVAHISDLHVDDAHPKDYYNAVIERLNEVDADLVFFTGDFITKPEHVSLLPDVLSGVKNRRGVFAVLGNHDHWCGSDSVSDAIESAGIVILNNGCKRIEVEDRGNVLICGCEEPWSETRWQAPSISKGDLVLALTHTADNIYQLNRAGVNATFAGHFHGGQVKLPWLGSVVVPSKYGRRFDHGHFVVDGTHLFVTSGIGAAFPPFRLYCQPDIFVVKFKGV